MGGAAGIFLELRLFIGFKCKLNTTLRLGNGNPVHLAYSAQYFKSYTQNSYTVLENCQTEDPSQKSVLLVLVLYRIADTLSSLLNI